MIDRFFGFRYEIIDNLPLSLLTKVQEYADDVGCFGWIQVTGDHRYVGEVRCNKVEGPIFLKWLTEQCREGALHTKIYEDTKIRLHFSHFKILDTSRETCFLDPPHQCQDKLAGLNKNIPEGMFNRASGDEL